MDKFILILKNVWEFLNSKVFLYIVIISTAIWFINTCGVNRDLEIEKKLNEQNLLALRDEIKIEKKKNGETKSSVAGFVTSLDSLKTLNRGLFDKVVSQKTQVISLTNAVAELEQDNFTLNKTLKSFLSESLKVNDSTYILDWKLIYNWDNPKTDVDTLNNNINLRTTNFDIFNGSTKIVIKVDNKKIKIISAKLQLNELPVDSNFNKKIVYNILDVNQEQTELFHRKSRIDLSFGEEVTKDNKLRVYITTKYPGFTSKSMEGYFIDPNTSDYIKGLMKKEHWFPNSWTFGIGVSLGYNLFGGKPYFGPGVSLTYNIYQW